MPGFLTFGLFGLGSYRLVIFCYFTHTSIYSRRLFLLRILICFRAAATWTYSTSTSIFLLCLELSYKAIIAADLGLTEPVWPPRNVSNVLLRDLFGRSIFVSAKLTLLLFCTKPRDLRAAEYSLRWTLVTASATGRTIGKPRLSEDAV